MIQANVMHCSTSIVWIFSCVRKLIPCLKEIVMQLGRKRSFESEGMGEAFPFVHVSVEVSDLQPFKLSLETTKHAAFRQGSDRGTAIMFMVLRFQILTPFAVLGKTCIPRTSFLSINASKKRSRVVPTLCWFLPAALAALSSNPFARSSPASN